jgi:hypothetical protein
VANADVVRLLPQVNVKAETEYGKRAFPVFRFLEFCPCILVSAGSFQYSGDHWYRKIESPKMIVKKPRLHIR